MTKTAAVAFEVRWRKNVDPANQWSTPVSVGADGHVKVPGLERVTDYTLEARAISGCGAKSAWAAQTLNLPDVPVGTLTLDDLSSEVTAAQTAADTANNQLAAVASDNTLSPAEKSVVMREYSVITTDQAGVDAQADAYVVSRSAYDSAISALTAYLATLTAPKAWNDKTGNTTVVGTTFRAKFNAVYTAQRTLLNAIYAAAKQRLDTNQPLVNNPYFSTGDLTGWTSDHGTVVFESGSNGPASASTTYARRNGSSGTPNESLRNTARIPVYPGAVIKAQCAIRGINTPNGAAGVRISWRDATDTEIGTTQGSTTTGNATNGTYVTGTAPAGAFFAHVECSFANHTTGSYTIDNFWASALADSMDQVPDGATRFGSIANAATQAQQAAQIAASYQPGQNILPNPSFALGATGWTFGAHWGVVNNIEAATEAAYAFQTSSSTDVCYTAWLPFGAGVPVCLGLDALCNGGIAGSILMDVQFASSTLTNLGYSNPLTIGPQSWSRVNGFVGNSLAGTAFARVRLYSQNASVSAIGPAARFTNLKLEIGSSPTPFSDDSTQYGNKLTVAASGQTIGDQRNLQPITWASQRSVLSNSPISFSISGTTVTFSVAAVTLQGGGISLNYGASSGSVTQSAGTTTTWFLYYRDAAQAGGSLPLNITTNPGGAASWPDSIFLGTAQVTVNSGGGGSGGTGSGGGGYCVADDMFIGDGRRAGDAEIGDPFDCIDLPTQAGKHVRALQGVTRGIEECVRMITSDGCALVCSVSTPFDLPDGRNSTAPHMLGEQVITDLGTATVTSLALVGPRPVTRAHLGGVSYAAGADPHRRIYSHNVGSTSKP